MATRKSAKDYLNDYNELQNKTIKLHNVLVERLLDLCKDNYNVPLDGNLRATDIKSKVIIESILSTKDIIEYIQKIETHLENKNKYVQGKLF